MLRAATQQLSCWAFAASQGGLSKRPQRSAEHCSPNNRHAGLLPHANHPNLALLRAGPDGSPCSSSSFGGGEVRSDSEWDKYSIKNALAGSTRACTSRQHSHQQLFLGDGVVSPSGGSAVLRQGGSLFGITSRRPILGVK